MILKNNILSILENPVILASLSGISATLITFLLSTALNQYLTVRENKRNIRAFLNYDEKLLRYDTYPELHEIPSKVINTDDYLRLLKEVERNEKFTGQKSPRRVTFIGIKNLGPGAAIQVEVGIRMVLTDSGDEEGWRIDVSVPILESGHSVYIPLTNYQYRDDFYITDTEIKYITQADEKMMFLYSAKKNEDDDEILDCAEKLMYRQFFIYRKLYKSKRRSSTWTIFFDNTK